MALDGAILGPLLSASVGAIDPAGLFAWNGVANALCNWLPTNATIISVSTVDPSNSLIAAGVAVTGTGMFAFLTPSPPDDLGTALAIGAGSADPIGLFKWQAVASAITDHFTNNGGLDSSLLVASPTGGPVTGTALGSISNDSVLGTALAAAVGAVDAPALILWSAIAAAMIGYMNTNMEIVIVAMASPPGGGPVTGIGVVS